MWKTVSPILSLISIFSLATFAETGGDPSLPSMGKEANGLYQTAVKEFTYVKSLDWKEKTLWLKDVGSFEGTQSQAIIGKPAMVNISEVEFRFQGQFLYRPQGAYGRPVEVINLKTAVQEKIVWPKEIKWDVRDEYHRDQWRLNLRISPSGQSALYKYKYGVWFSDLKTGKVILHFPETNNHFDFHHFLADGSAVIYERVLGGDSFYIVKPDGAFKKQPVPKSLKNYLLGYCLINSQGQKLILLCPNEAQQVTLEFTNTIEVSTEALSFPILRSFGLLVDNIDDASVDGVCPGSTSEYCRKVVAGNYEFVETCMGSSHCGLRLTVSAKTVIDRYQKSNMSCYDLNPDSSPAQDDLFNPRPKGLEKFCVVDIYDYAKGAGSLGSFRAIELPNQVFIQPTGKRPQFSWPTGRPFDEFVTPGIFDDRDGCSNPAGGISGFSQSCLEAIGPIPELNGNSIVRVIRIQGRQYGSVGVSSESTWWMQVSKDSQFLYQKTK